MIDAPSATTSLAAVIGSPVTHSLSPAIHNRAFADNGLDWCFVAFDVAAGRGAAALAAMASLGIDGFAVTTPLKEEMSTLVDEVDDSARTLRSVNTVCRRADGSTFGASTDGDGFVASLVHEGVDPVGRNVVVLGAGAAARSIIDGLGRAGCADIVVVNRTPAAAERAAALVDTARVGSLDDIADAQVLVNATSVGLGDQHASPLDGEQRLRGDLVVADIVYHPLETKLLRDASKVGAKVIDGLGMLVCQAQLQQRLWTGVAGDYRSLREAAQAQLDLR